MPQSLKSRQALSKLALTARYNPEDVETLAQLRAELRACALEDRVQQALAEAPPIPLERILAIADLLVRSAASQHRAAS